MNTAIHPLTFPKIPLMEQFNRLRNTEYNKLISVAIR